MPRHGIRNEVIHLQQESLLGRMVAAPAGPGGRHLQAQDGLNQTLLALAVSLLPARRSPILLPQKLDRLVDLLATNEHFHAEDEIRGISRRQCLQAFKPDTGFHHFIAFEEHGDIGGDIAGIFAVPRQKRQHLLAGPRPVVLSQVQVRQHKTGVGRLGLLQSDNFFQRFDRLLSFRPLREGRQEQRLLQQVFSRGSGGQVLVDQFHRLQQVGIPAPRGECRPWPAAPR